MSDFDKELERILLKASGGISEFLLSNEIDAIKRAVEKHIIPNVSSSSEQLDKANAHLDTRSQASWSAWNKGFISNTTQSLKALWGDSK